MSNIKFNDALQFLNALTFDALKDVGASKYKDAEKKFNKCVALIRMLPKLKRLEERDLKIKQLEQQNKHLKKLNEDANRQIKQKTNIPQNNIRDINIPKNS